MVSCNGPSLSEWENTHAYVWPFSRGKKGWCNLSCLSNHYALHDLKRTEIPHFATPNVHCQSLFCGFSVLCVSWSANQRKASWLFCSSPVRPRETTREKCQLVTQAGINQVKQLLVLLRFSFYSVLVWVHFFFFRHDFPLKCSRESPGNRPFNKSPGLSCLVLLVGDHQNQGSAQKSPLC